MSPIRLFYWQRMTAMVLAPLVVVHLIVIVYATARGLTAAEILGRTRGSVLWGAFYALFVAAAAVHGAIGVRNVAHEWLGWRPVALDRLTLAMGALLLVLGLRAVAAVVLP